MEKNQKETVSEAEDLTAWEKENAMIAVMIRMYCRKNHKAARKEAIEEASKAAASEGKEEGGKASKFSASKIVCPECADLTEYALLRLKKCPFKDKKQFCSSCKIHCYKPEYREKIRKVMRYSGPRMILVAPGMVFSHAKQSRNKG